MKARIYLPLVYISKNKKKQIWSDEIKIQFANKLCLYLKPMFIDNTSWEEKKPIVWEMLKYR